MRSVWIFLLAAIWPGAANFARATGLDWPAGRLLPAFSTPAQTLDCIDLAHVRPAEIDLFTSLEGIVNRTQPRLACVPPEGEGQFTWLDLHHLHYKMVDGYDAIAKYRGEFTGLVVPDPAQPHTLNLATTMAGVNNELICAPELLPRLTNAPYNIPVLDDLRGRFTNKFAVYNYLYSNYWPRCTHRIIAGMGTNAHGDLRDYLVAVKAATVWMSPGSGKTREAALLKKFVSQMKPAAGVYMGWWPGEGAGLNWIAQFGIPVLASDFFRNATVYGGIRREIHVPAIPPPPPLENKVYVALIISDGDNIQYMQHTMKEQWDKPGRGKIPMGWTVSPLSVDMDPTLLDYYWSTATTNDCLVSGPSGAGYTHLNRWNPADQDAFARVSGPYLEKSGLRVITVWDCVDRHVARAFAKNCPHLLGLTDEGGKYNHVDKGLRTIGLTPAYTSHIDQMLAGITNAAKKWDGKQPLFIAAQSDVWNLGPAGLAKVAAALDTNEYHLVRPDQLFLLANEHQSSRKKN